MLTSTEILDFLKQNKSFILENFHCNQIGIFGSFARNEQNEQSDIDILVRFSEDAPDLYNIESRLKEYLKSEFNKDIDICSEKWIKPVFRSLVMKEAIYV